jgi:hypothetical protein
MLSIEWLTGRGNTEPVERSTYAGDLERAAFIHAHSNFADVKRRHPTVTGFRIADDTGRAVGGWFVGENYT